MSDKLWKSAERKVATLLGGQRVPVTGRQRGSAPDVEHPFFSIEVKHRESLPDWLMDAMNQADESNPGDKMSIVILHEKGKNYTESLTVLRLSDIITLYRKIGDLEEEVSDLQYQLRYVTEAKI